MPAEIGSSGSCIPACLTSSNGWALHQSRRPPNLWQGKLKSMVGCPEPDVSVKHPAVIAHQEPLLAHLGPQTWQAYLSSMLNNFSYSGCGRTQCLPGFHVCTTFACQMRSWVAMLKGTKI
eukprot:897692-Pelagomonas_calceolata.AAC.2